MNHVTDSPECRALDCTSAVLRRVGAVGWLGASQTSPWPVRSMLILHFLADVLINVCYDRVIALDARVARLDF